MSGPFLVISENTCCGCSAPVFAGLYATEAEAERVKVDIQGDAYGEIDVRVIQWTGTVIEDWGE